MDSNIVLSPIPPKGEILKQIHNWCDQQVYLKYLPNINDGWERWAQLDIAFYLWSTKAFNAFVEQYVYEGTDNRMDMQVNFKNEKRSDFVELKAFSFLVPKVLAEFMKDVISDAHKLSQGTFRPKFNGGYAWAIGLLPKSIVLDYSDEKISAYTGSRDDKTAVDQRLNSVLSLFNGLDDTHSIQLSFANTNGPLVLVYWHGQIVNTRVQ